MRNVALLFNLHVGKTVLTSMRNLESTNRNNLVYLEAILVFYDFFKENPHSLLDRSVAGV